MFSKEILILFFLPPSPVSPFELKVFHHLKRVGLVNKYDQG